MKTIINEYIKIAMYVIFGILLIMSGYIIILNINHYQSLSSKTVVSEVDNDYTKYKENVNLIENLTNKISNENKVKNSLTNVVRIMKSSGVYRLIPKMEIKYKDLYELNDYFMEELINNSWVSSLQEHEISNKYQDEVMMLVNNSNYLNSVFISNSLVLYDSNLDNKVEDNYHFLLKNYLMYSNVILSICNEIGGVNE